MSLRLYGHSNGAISSGASEIIACLVETLARMSEKSDLWPPSGP